MTGQVAAAITLLASVPACGSQSPAPQASSSHAPATTATKSVALALPAVTPRPQRIWRAGGDLTVTPTVDVIAKGGVDQSTTDLLTSVLRAAGAQRVRVVSQRHRGWLTVLAGHITDPDIAGALRKDGVTPKKQLPAQGYALAAAGDTVVIGGQDADGIYYAAQTLRQLASQGRIAGAAVVDYPDMPLRGTIEGFYGAPWSQSERMEQLAFYGSLKLNDYVYTPKDDPYLRQRWRDPYPAQQLRTIATLVGQAKAHHVHFTYAVSPGPTICFSDPADIRALENKLSSVYAIGVRDFAVPFDDISYDRWNCAGDQNKYGPAGQAAAGHAQADVLNAVWRDFAAPHHVSLASVPTEYHNLDDTPYKQAIRATLNPNVALMWTGPAVVPASISKAQAAEADRLWGRKVLLWDNYPVNDYQRTAGRLLLGPYDNRAAGLSAQVSGDLLNPMNQAAASKVALFGGADYSWHDTGYDPQRAWRAAADYFSGGDRPTSDALLAFFDTEHYAPTSLNSGQAAQPQAPVLAKKIAAFHSRWRSGDKTGSIAALRDYAGELAGAPARIRAGVSDQIFLSDTKPWLDALSLWGQAFVTTLDGLQAAVEGNADTAKQRFTRSRELAAQAAAIHTVPGKTKPQGPVKVADGVLDVFLKHAPGLVG
ncbi:MAG: beta-N-acetylglucosaminidase domain-containing protein [Sciscionella sp.]